MTDRITLDRIRIAFGINCRHGNLGYLVFHAPPEEYEPNFLDTCIGIGEWAKNEKRRAAQIDLIGRD